MAHFDSAYHEAYSRKAALPPWKKWRWSYFGPSGWEEAAIAGKISYSQDTLALLKNLQVVSDVVVQNLNMLRAYMLWYQEGMVSFR